MPVSPEFMKHLQREVAQEIDGAIRKDHQKIVEMIDHKIDGLLKRARKEDQSGGNSGPERAIIDALNDIRMKL